MKLDWEVQSQFAPLYHIPNFYEMSFSGGRSAAKSAEVAQWIVLQALEIDGTILCARHIQKTLDKSVSPLIQRKINDLGVKHLFKFKNNKFYCQNGVDICFAGLQKHLVEDTIKSFDNLKVLWIEEAQTVPKDVMDILLPTVREANAKVVFTWNHRYETDAVSERFYVNEPPPNSHAFQVYWWQNKHLSQRAVDMIEYEKHIDIDGYNHIYEGDYLKENEELKLFNRSRLQDIVEFCKNNDIEQFKGEHCAGFDIADTGNDSNALCLRSGSIIFDIQEWSKAPNIKDSVTRAHDGSINNHISTLTFDATGIGAGARGDFLRLNVNYQTIPFLGAAQPKGVERDYFKGISNGQYFMNAKAQAWWHIRKRYENTLVYMMDGILPDDGKLLLFDSNMKTDVVKKLVEELSQVQYNQDNKLKIDKAPGNNVSPNLADALVLSFQNDISKKRGLRA